MRNPMKMRALAVTLSVLMAVPAWMWAAITTPQLPNPGQVGYTKAEQIQLGQKAEAEVYKQMPVLPDSSALTRYVNELGNRLKAVIPPQYNWPYQFHVIPQKDINAFALPGGQIFVNVGTIQAADNEAELAGVMAHEMSHVYMQHSIKQMKQNQGPSILAGLGQILGSMIGGVGGALASLGGQMVGGMWSMKYSRADEAQADAVGAIIMYKAGYDPHYLALFFQKLEKEAGANGTPQFLSDHPAPGNRYQAISDEVRNWPRRNYTNSSSQFQQAHADALRTRTYTAQQIADMQKSGQIQNTSVPVGAQQQPATMGNVAESQVMPSGQFQTFNGGQFTIDYPSNWQPTQDQQSGGVTIAPSAGAVQGAIAYGVVIGAAQLQNAGSLDDATNQVVQGMVQQNQGLRQTGGLQNIRVNGIAGRSVEMTGMSPITENGRQLPEQDWLVTIPYGQQGGVVYLVFVAPQRDFGRLKNTYTEMLRTFHLGQ
ncbi:MAG: M48 family metalloprotease [Terriglobales bacterium]